MLENETTETWGGTWTEVFTRTWVAMVGCWTLGFHRPCEGHGCRRSASCDGGMSGRQRRRNQRKLRSYRRPVAAAWQRKRKTGSVE